MSTSRILFHVHTMAIIFMVHMLSTVYSHRPHTASLLYRLEHAAMEEQGPYIEGTVDNAWSRSIDLMEHPCPNQSQTHESLLVYKNKLWFGHHIVPSSYHICLLFTQRPRHGGHHVRLFQGCHFSQDTLIISLNIGLISSLFNKMTKMQLFACWRILISALKMEGCKKDDDDAEAEGEALNKNRKTI